MADRTKFGPKLGPILGKDMTGHQNYTDTIRNGGSDIVTVHFPREVRQFENTEQALSEGFIPFISPRAWSIGLSRLRPVGLNRERNTVDGYEGDLILDSVDVPEGVEGYVASLTSWSDESVNYHFNVSAQFYRRRG